MFDSDKGQRIFWPDLGSKCLEMIPADNIWYSCMSLPVCGKLQGILW